MTKVRKKSAYLPSFESAAIFFGILFSVGTLFFYIPPSKVLLFFQDAPFYSPFSEEHAQRRELHVLMQNLEKDAFFEKNKEKMRTVTLVLAQQERFQDAARILLEAMKWDPQDIELRLDAAKMLLLATRGILVPKIQSLLHSIPKTSSFYLEAQELLRHR